MTLKEMLNEKGFKKISKENPLLLQSEVLVIVEEWLKPYREFYEDNYRYLAIVRDALLELLDSLIKDLK